MDGDTMECIEGNLLQATEDYIVQQCCCTACRPHGLSESIANEFSHGNLYSLRKPIAPRKNTARAEDRGIPGTSIILGDGKSHRFIACLLGQYAMGKPGKYDSFGIPDSKQDRERYFQESLEHLSSQIPESCSLAFPYQIGCGLAGGDWTVYKKILDTWAKKHPMYKVVLYKLPN
jgi:hypothetical protein